METAEMEIFKFLNEVYRVLAMTFSYFSFQEAF